MNESDAVHRTRLMLASIVTDFADTWDKTGEPPNLAEYLPGTPGLRRMCLIELIKVDLEYRWLRYNHPKRLTQYRAEYAELRTGPTPPDLAYEEFHVRRRSGRDQDQDDQPTEMDATATVWSEIDYRSTLIAPPRAQQALDGVRVGTSVDDFDLLVGLGSGAFARVFLARQRSMQRLVAVKISYNRGAEPETLAQLDHEYIVRVFDHRLIRDGELKLMYMQYLPGGTLLGVLNLVRSRSSDSRTGALLIDAVDQAIEDTGGIIPNESDTRSDIIGYSWPETVAWLGSRLAEALDYAARTGVLHRDIKPANVLLTAEGVPKLADFNVSFSHHVAGTNPMAYFGGSLAYMSPEQLAACHPELPTTAGDLDVRSDIYALGVMLWELLTGRRPFDDEPQAGESETSLGRMLELRKNDIEPRYLSELPPDCPPTLRRVLLKCLAPQRDNRWSTGTELAQQFELCLDRRARDLVDPQRGSLRSKVGPWSLAAIVTLASATGGMLGVLYGNVHNRALIDAWIPDDQRESLQGINPVLELIIPLLVLVVTNYLCRRVFLVVWRGLRKGRTFTPEMLALARRDSLTVGDRVAWVAFAGWATGAMVTAFALRNGTDLSPARVVHLSTSLLVCGAIAVAYPFFLVTLFVVRTIYPRLLLHGTTAADYDNLRALSRRSTRYLAVAASIPLIGVVHGLMFLEPEEVTLVTESIRWLAIAGVFGFIGNYWLHRKLEDDLRAFQRTVSGRSRGQTKRARNN
ncbi:serine/threonine protein kinase [Nocardia sp. NBC_00565]|uniref:serine/threonine-protein kinase n=1 Tax=Nocardia sp. NBC_00565 TaxID=2975993 RepID=UPI002E7FE252|nr:serine/threonine-protein kinase [Nocardia sp. NBC_00565]WUC00224.1 serine/threonine protein kinase [Nocardia sp. NBC_00565]